MVYGSPFHRDSQTAPRGGVAGIERIFCESRTATAGGSLLENVGHRTVRVSCVSSSTTSHDGSTPLASWCDFGDETLGAPACDAMSADVTR